MILEILLGITISIILIIGFFFYLKWCSDTYDLLDSQITSYSIDEYKKNLSENGAYLLPEFLSDTYKPINWFIVYYWTKANI